MSKIKKRTYHNLKTNILRPRSLVLILILAIIGTLAAKVIFAASTSLSLVPSQTSVNAGSTFNVAIRVNSGTEPINVVQANIAFDTTKLQYTSSNFANSAFGLDVSTQVGSGTVQIARGTIAGAPAATGDNLVATLVFKVIGVGNAPISFTAGSMVVRSSDSTNILAVQNGTTITAADTVAPTVPTNLSASGITLSALNIAWGASSDNVGVTGYRVFRNGIQITSTTSPSFADSGLTSGTTYSYKVAAVDAVGNVSSQSAALSVSTLQDNSAPTVPGKPTSTSQTLTAINLTWTASTDNIAVVGYKIFRNGTLVSSPTGTSYTDSNLTPNTSYNYTVAAVDSVGNTSAQSAVSAIKTLADISSPSVPSNLKGTVTGRSAALTWTASTDNIGVTNYIIYRDGVQVNTTTSNSYTVTDNSYGSRTFSVAAKDAAGNISNQSTAIILPIINNGDINKDNKINALDLSVILTNWGRSGSSAGDVNGDNVVNALDLSIILSGWSG